MFNPRQLVTSQVAIEGEILSPLKKLLITKENSTLQKIESNEHYSNTRATLDTFSKYRPETTLNRQLNYDRINIDEFLKDNGVVSKDVNGMDTITLLCNTVTGFNSNADIEQFANCLSESYGHDVHPDDFNTNPIHPLQPTQTPFGEVLAKANCDISHGWIRYTNGTLPVTPVTGLDNTLTNLKALTFTREWKYDEEVKLTLPPSNEASDWIITIDECELPNHTSASKPWIALTVDTDSNRWLLKIMNEDVPHILPQATYPELIIKLVNGKIQVNCGSEEYVATSTTSDFDRGLYRVSAITRNVSPRPIAFRYSLKTISVSNVPTLTCTRDYNPQDHLIIAAPESTTVIGGAIHPITLVNNICKGYVEVDTNDFSPSDTVVNSEGSIDKLVKMSTDEEVTVIYTINSLVKLIEDKTLRGFYVSVESIENPKDRFNLEFYVNSVTDDIRYRLTLDGVVTSDVLLTEELTNEFELVIKRDSVTVNNHESAYVRMISHLGKSDRPSNYRISFGIQVLTGTVLPDVIVSQQSTSENE